MILQNFWIMLKRRLMNDHIIAVNANYSGPLRKGEFQFSFGGNTIHSNGNTGFLGRIQVA